MRNNVVWQVYNNSGWWPLFMLGVSLVLFSGLVLVHPEILAYLVAFFLLSAGFGVIGTSLAMRRSNRGQRHSRDLFEDGF